MHASLLSSPLLSLSFFYHPLQTPKKLARRKQGTPLAKASWDLVMSFGEMLIDFVPDEAGVSLAESKGFVKAAGGAPANVAVAAARLGGRSAFIGKFGDDEFGHMLVNILKENNVDTTGVRFDCLARTALAFVTLTRSGKRKFMFYRNPSADMLLTESELDHNLIRHAGIFHFGSISLNSESCRSAHIAAMVAARKAGAILTYDANVRLPLWPSEDAARVGVLSVWNQVDVFKVSDEEVAFLTQGDAENEEVVMSLWFEGLKLLIVTAGAKGSRYYTKGFKGMVPGYEVEKVDTTSAGDAFVGSLLCSISKDKNILENEEKLREVLVLASACGAITATRKGAIPALPTSAMVQQFFANPEILLGSREDLHNGTIGPSSSLRRRKGVASSIGNDNQPGTELHTMNGNLRCAIFAKVVIGLSFAFIFLVVLLHLIRKLMWVHP